MPVTNVTSGTEVATTTTSLDLVAPTVLGDDIMLAHIMTNDNVAVVAPAAWALIRADNNTTGLRTSLFWKRASGSDSGSTNSFTIAGTTLGYGVITAWRGAARSGSPIGQTSFSANAVSDTVTYATLTPQRAHGVVIASGFYLDDATTAGAISGTNPTFANIVDVETLTGSGGSLFVYWGAAPGIATGARSHATTSTTDAISSGVLLELLTQNDSGGGAGNFYPSVTRTRGRRGAQS
jgi:hypothetical protein